MRYGLLAVLVLSGCSAQYKKPCIIDGIRIELDDSFINDSKCDSRYDDNGKLILFPSYVSGCQAGKTLIIDDTPSNWSHEMRHLINAYCPKE